MMVKAWGARLITGEARGLGAGLARGGLTVASWGYGVGVSLARGLRTAPGLRPQRLSRPVVSIGNLTWGGTGKTPLVAHLASCLTQRGVRVAILTRGYGGDEPAVLRRLARDVPVFVGRDRVATGQDAIAAGAELLLLDDGFQHWRLARALDLVLLDAEAPFGNGHLLPRGSLREPIAQLRRAAVVVFMERSGCRVDVAPVAVTVRALAPAALVVTARYQPVAYEVWPAGRGGASTSGGGGLAELPLSTLAGVRACVLSGIAAPGAFEAMVTRLGVEPALTRRFLDHHPYRDAELAAVAAACRRAGVGWIVTTLKDAVRLPRGPWLGAGVQVAVLQVAVEVSEDEELLQRLVAVSRR